MIVVDKRGIDIMERTWRCPCINEDRGDWIIDTEVVCDIILYLLAYLC